MYKKIWSEIAELPDQIFKSTRVTTHYLYGMRIIKINFTGAKFAIIMR